MSRFCGKCGSLLDEKTGLCPKGCLGNAVGGQFSRAPREDHDNYEGSASVPQGRPQERASSPYEGGKTVGGTPVNSAVHTQAAPTEQKKSPHKAVLIVFVVVLLLVSGLACLGALSYFNVIEIPVVSEAIDRLLGNGASETESDKTATDAVTDAAPTTDAARPTDGVSSNSETETAVPATEFSVSGVLTAEEYLLNGAEKRISYILVLDSKIECKTYAPYDSVYGERIETDKIEVFGENAGSFCQKHVTVHGKLSYASENYHRETVLLTDCTFEITADDIKYNNEHEESTTEKGSEPVSVTENSGRPSLFRPDQSYYINNYKAYCYCHETSVQDYVKMRSGPDKYTYDIVTILDNNTLVTVETASYNGWTLCVADGVEGWIRSDFLFDSPQP